MRIKNNATRKAVDHHSQVDNGWKKLTETLR